MAKALITGGTRGIGAAVAGALREAGHEVLVTGRSANGKPPAGCDFVACDFSNPTELSCFAESLPSLGIAMLVNSAGVNKVGPMSEYAVEDFLWVHQVNVVAPFVVTKAVIPGMRARRFGRVVNITSIFGVVSRPGRAAYSASKFGLFGLSRALALEVASDNVLVNCVAPGFVDTDLTRRVLGPQQIEEVTAQIPMHRLAKPEEIARVIRFLVSDENTYITGQNVVVDGGFTSA
jgi:3-oxoacyl-[acyl-carrier protein] reductase